ncbi:heme oxygenase [Sphingobium xanthum]|jgi:heme oxygenase|uniref:biliverdin-producing heme oxygenase n=1 Tax=Sphingobium xanthum TaxID=1387165 RepID=UPI001FEB9CA7|nr:biliverdin-producing heme oxygenase [Sphingobium xanthum]
MTFVAPALTPDGRETTGRKGFHARLRAATRACHDKVDALFGQFDLADAASYGKFLTAHAMALVPVEDWADVGRLIPGWSGRKVALYEDLAALGLTFPPFEPLSWPRDPAARWGAAYVIEGSRLGGLMLSRSIGEGLPRAYLSARHGPGGWQSLLRAMEEKAEQGGERWEAEAFASAERTFGLYAHAAQLMTAR